MTNSVGAIGWLIHKYGIPNGWTETVVGDLARVVGGATPSRTDLGYWAGGTVPWFTPSDLTAQAQKWVERSAELITARALEECACALLPAGTVLYTSRATIGAKAIAKVPVTTNQGFASFIPKEGVEGEFFYYFLEHLTPVFVRLAAGTTFLEVNKRDIRRVRCAFPPLPEQIAIAKVLGAMDAAINRVQGNVRISAAPSLGESLVDAYASVRKALIGELMTGQRRLDPNSVAMAEFTPATLMSVPAIVSDHQ